MKYTNDQITTLHLNQTSGSRSFVMPSRTFSMCLLTCIIWRHSLSGQRKYFYKSNIFCIFSLKLNQCQKCIKAAFCWNLCALIFCCCKMSSDFLCLTKETVGYFDRLLKHLMPPETRHFIDRVWSFNRYKAPLEIDNVQSACWK